MGDASAACYEHMHAGLGALLVSGAPLAASRDGLAFEDRSVERAEARSNGNVQNATDMGFSQQCHSAGHSGSVNGLHGLEAQRSKEAQVGRRTAETKPHTKV